MPKERNEQECLPLHMDYLPERFYQKALEELNETPEAREVEMNKLIDLLSADKWAIGIEFEVDFLQLFLRHSKYNSWKAYQYLLKFLTFRRNYSTLFQSLPDEYFKLNSYANFVSVLPYRSPDGCVILHFDMSKWNPNEVSLEDLKKIGMLVCLQTLRCPITQISGFKTIYDFKDSVKHLKYCTPQNIKLLYDATLNCIPARYKEFHCVNKNVLLTAIWSIMRHIISEKFRKRIYFHSSPKDLLNYFPSSIIPSQYGGTLKDYHDSELIRKLNKGQENYPQGGLPNYF